MVETVNRLVINDPTPDKLEQLEDIVATICAVAKQSEGFISGEVLRRTGDISILGSRAGSVVQDELSGKEFLIVVRWESEEAHEKSHQHPDFEKNFKKLFDIADEGPYEPFYEVLWSGTKYEEEAKV